MALRLARDEPFLTPPPEGWLHDQFALACGGGVYYSMQLKHSLRSVEFSDRNRIVQEAVARLREAGHTRAKVERQNFEVYARFLTKKPNVVVAPVNISISSDGVVITTPNQEKIISNHKMTGISFAAGGDFEDYDCVAFVSKCKGNSRMVHAFDCGNLSNQVLATIGQAFVAAQQAQEEEVPEEYCDQYEECDDEVEGDAYEQPLDGAEYDEGGVQYHPTNAYEDGASEHGYGAPYETVNAECYAPVDYEAMRGGSREYMYMMPALNGKGSGCSLTSGHSYSQIGAYERMQKKEYEECGEEEYITDNFNTPGHGKGKNKKKGDPNYLAMKAREAKYEEIKAQREKMKKNPKGKNAEKSNYYEGDAYLDDLQDPEYQVGASSQRSTGGEAMYFMAGKGKAAKGGKKAAKGREGPAYAMANKRGSSTEPTYALANKRGSSTEPTYIMANGGGASKRTSGADQDYALGVSKRNSSAEGDYYTQANGGAASKRNSTAEDEYTLGVSKRNSSAEGDYTLANGGGASKRNSGIEPTYAMANGRSARVNGAQSRPHSVASEHIYSMGQSSRPASRPTSQYYACGDEFAEGEAGGNGYAQPASDAVEEQPVYGVLSAQQYRSTSTIRGRTFADRLASLPKNITLGRQKQPMASTAEETSETYCDLAEEAETPSKNAKNNKKIVAEGEDYCDIVRGHKNDDDGEAYCDIAEGVDVPNSKSRARGKKTKEEESPGENYCDITESVDAPNSKSRPRGKKAAADAEESLGENYCDITESSDAPAVPSKLRQQMKKKAPKAPVAEEPQDEYCDVVTEDKGKPRVAKRPSKTILGLDGGDCYVDVTLPAAPAGGATTPKANPAALYSVPSKLRLNTAEPQKDGDQLQYIQAELGGMEIKTAPAPGVVYSTVVASSARKSTMEGAAVAEQKKEKKGWFGRKKATKGDGADTASLKTATPQPSPQPSPQASPALPKRAAPKPNPEKMVAKLNQKESLREGSICSIASTVDGRKPTWSFLDPKKVDAATDE